jgi:hypothetical protein
MRHVDSAVQASFPCSTKDFGARCPTPAPCDATPSAGRNANGTVDDLRLSVDQRVPVRLDRRRVDLRRTDVHDRLWDHGPAWQKQAARSSVEDAAAMVEYPLENSSSLLRSSSSSTGSGPLACSRGTRIWPALYDVETADSQRIRQVKAPWAAHQGTPLRVSSWISQTPVSHRDRPRVGPHATERRGVWRD